jgi:putative membrane protein
MRFIFLVLLVLLFGYSMALVLFNHADTPVDLIFTQITAMNLGLLLVLTLFIGLVAGLLMGILVFRVIQTRWEIGRLNKELELVRTRHIQAATAAAAATAANTASTVSQVQLSKPEDKHFPPMM